MTAYGGRDDALFVGASPESPFWPTQRTVADMEFQFDRFVKDTGCASVSQDALDCLRAANLSSIVTANVDSPFPGASSSPNPLWYFLPVIDGVFVVDNLYNLFSQGKFVQVAVLVGHDTDEGTAFSANASSPAEVANFMKNNYPSLSDEQLRAINDAYPLTEPLPRHAAYFPSAAGAYGDATFTCPALAVANSVAKDLFQTFVYRYNVLDPDNLASGMGVPHTFESTAIFGVGNAGDAAPSYSSSNAGIVSVTMNYWISFVRSLNPNPFRAPGAPVWEPWDVTKGRSLRLQTNQTAMEELTTGLNKTCKLWEKLLS
jgi:carboxylesterase type B